MAMTFTARTLTVSINCPAAQVYEFVSNPQNLPRWAKGLCKSVRQSDTDWIVETPQEPTKIRFAPKNDFGVLDHYVSPSPGVEIYVPMRVVPNGAGSEIIFTVFRSPEMSDEQFAEDIGLVERDLETLERVLER
jgi:hypothetical protein